MVSCLDRDCVFVMLIAEGGRGLEGPLAPASLLLSWGRQCPVTNLSTNSDQCASLHPNGSLGECPKVALFGSSFLLVIFLVGSHYDDVIL